MGKQFTLNQSIKEAVFEALLQMLKTRSLDEVHINQLVQKAGICRTSYYRNFDSKEDILIQYLNLIYEDYFKNYDFTSNQKKDETIYDFVYQRICFIKKHRNFFVILQKEKLLYSVFRQIDLNNLHCLLQHTKKNDILNSYQIAIAVGITTAIIDEWINSEFKETEHDLASMLTSIFGTLL